MVLGWVVYQTTRSEFLVAVFTAVRLSPMLLGPFSGVFADRHNRVRLLILACSWALLAMSAVAAMTSIGFAPYWALLVGGLAIGLAQSPSQPARAALVLELVGRESLSSANALNAMVLNMTQVLGPSLGGVMISVFGPPAALWVSTAWYGVSLAMLFPLRGHEAMIHAHTESAVGMIIRGIRGIVRNRLARTVLLVTVAANIFLWPVYQSFMPIFAQESLGIDAAGLGWLLTCSGAGGLVGSLVIAGLGDFRLKGGLFVIGTATWAALWALFALSHDVVTSFVLMGAIGLTSAAFGVLQTTLLMMTTEPTVHGRVLGLQELAIGAMPVSLLGLGAAAEAFGVGTTTFISALLLIASLLALALWTPQLLRYSGIRQSPSGTVDPVGEA